MKLKTDWDNCTFIAECESDKEILKKLHLTIIKEKNVFFEKDEKLTIITYC